MIEGRVLLDELVLLSTFLINFDAKFPCAKVRSLPVSIHFDEKYFLSVGKEQLDR